MDANHDVPASPALPEPSLCGCGHSEDMHYTTSEQDLDGCSIGGPYDECGDCLAAGEDGSAHVFAPALPEPPRQWGYDRTLHMFVGTPGVNGEVQTRVALESFEDVKVADLYASWGLTRAVALALLAPAPALPVEGDDSDRIEAARVKRWTYVHAATDNPTEDGIWKAINDRIGWGYSGVSGARESECNQDIRDAIAAIRADERRASEERERVLRAALEDVIREWDNNDRLFSAAYRMTEVARRALLIPENAASSEGEGQ